ncbi:MAG TPA: protein kinase [Anaeromyxobacteraceae bacterium]|nr:protein kinase [Anaeromyxobacteraceae bacterium]
MTGTGEQGTEIDATGTIQPGRLTALLQEIAQAPEAAKGSAWDLALWPGAVVGRFELLREIGRGAFGVVWEARDRELGRSVAFKAVRAGVHVVGGDELLAEAEAAAKLAHPNIVHLYDYGRCEHGPYLILELLRGETLDERLRRGPLTLREALRVAVEVSRGLAHAHGQGVVHRDLKPGNVYLCDDGQVKVLDFGLALVFGRTGLAGGTPAYMAPEQARGQIGDQRSDVYALGAMVVELLTGRLPYDPRGERGVPAGGTPPELPGIPAALARILGRMLAREPEERPANGEEALLALAALQKAMEPRRRVWVAWTLAACAAAAAAALALRPQRLPAGRLLVAVADTDNRTGDPDLDGAGVLFQSALEQSRRVSLMTRSRLLTLLREGGRPAPAVIGEAEARAAARMAGAQMILVPAIQPAGNGYDLAVRAVDPSRNESLFGVRERAAAKASLYPAIDRITAGVRKALHEEASETPRKPVSAAEIAPAHPEALRLYAEGKRLEAEARYGEAVEAFEKAAAADAEFPLPRLEIVQSGFGVFLSAPMDGRTFAAHVEALRRNLHRLPESDRPWADHALTTIDRGFGNRTEMIASLDRAIEARPEDPRPYIRAANILLFERGDLEAARPYVDRAAVLAPLEGMGDVIDYLVLAERLDDAFGQARRWTELSPTPVAFANLAAVHLARGEIPEAVEVARRANARWGKMVLEDVLLEADALEEAEREYAAAGRRPPPLCLALRGRLREALAMFDADPETLGPSYYGDRHADRSLLLAQRGDVDAVWAEVEKALSRNPGFPWQAVVLAALGDVARSKALGGRLAHDHHAGFRTARAVVAWKSGDREGALRSLAAIRRPLSDVYRGEILSELGLEREAVEAFRRYRRLRLAGYNGDDWLLNPWAYPRSLYLEAAALDRLGERDEARRVLGRLLRLWQRADPDLPLVAQMKALRRKIGATP